MHMYYMSPTLICAKTVVVHVFCWTSTELNALLGSITLCSRLTAKRNHHNRAATCVYIVHIFIVDTMKHMH